MYEALQKNNNFHFQLTPLMKMKTFKTYFDKTKKSKERNFSCLIRHQANDLRESLTESVHNKYN